MAATAAPEMRFPVAAPVAASPNALDVVGQLNMRELIQLRWIAVAGQIVTIAVVSGGFGIQLPVLPMLLDEEEATTLAIALRAASATVAGIDDTARGLLSKLCDVVFQRFYIFLQRLLALQLLL